MLPKIETDAHADADGNADADADVDVDVDVDAGVLNLIHKVIVAITFLNKR